LSQIRELESEAARAENIAKTAQEKYEKLKAFQGNAVGKHRKRISSTRTPAKGTIIDLSSPSAFGIDRKRRRQSDGIVITITMSQAHYSTLQIEIMHWQHLLPLLKGGIRMI
jgi:hypothetical protein